METNEEFNKTIFNILKLHNLDEEVINNVFINKDDNMNILRKAFVDKTYDPIDNNQLLAAKGSVLVQYIASLYIDIELPNMTTAFQYNTTLSKLCETKNYARLTLDYGLEKFIKYNKLKCNWLTYVDNCSFEDTNFYQNMCSNVFQALIYCISEVLRGNYGGSDRDCSYAFTLSSFQKLQISLDYENVVSPISRLHEIYQKIGIKEVERKRYIHVKVRNNVYDDKYRKLTGKNIDDGNKVIGFGYMLTGKQFTLISAVGDKFCDDAKEKVARELLKKYELLGIAIPKPTSWIDF